MEALLPVLPPQPEPHGLEEVPPLEDSTPCASGTPQPPSFFLSAFLLNADPLPPQPDFYVMLEALPRFLELCPTSGPLHALECLPASSWHGRLLSSPFRGHLQSLPLKETCRDPPILDFSLPLPPLHLSHLVHSSRPLNIVVL